MNEQSAGINLAVPIAPIAIGINVLMWTCKLSSNTKSLSYFMLHDKTSCPCRKTCLQIKRDGRTQVPFFLPQLSCTLFLASIQEPLQVGCLESLKVRMALNYKNDAWICTHLGQTAANRCMSTERVHLRESLGIICWARCNCMGLRIVCWV